jgi:hypothetical protein
MTEYITPRQIATESSTTPKSVMKTMVGGYFWAASCALVHTAVASARTTIKKILRWNARIRIQPASPKMNSVL